MMNYAIVPHWFSGYNSLFEMIFFIVAFMVGIYALRIYKLSSMRDSRLFGTSFLMFSGAYLIQSILNFAASYSMSMGACHNNSLFSMHSLSAIAIYLHIILFTAGLVTLAYMALRIRNFAAYSFFLAVTVLIILFSSNILYTFYAVSSILLVYILFYYLRNYLRTRKKTQLMVFVAFLFLLFAKIHFIFSLNHGSFYVAGHILEFIAYALVFASLITIIRRK